MSHKVDDNLICKDLPIFYYSDPAEPELLKVVELEMKITKIIPVYNLFRMVDNKEIIFNTTKTLMENYEIYVKIIRMMRMFNKLCQKHFPLSQYRAMVHTTYTYLKKLGRHLFVAKEVNYHHTYPIPMDTCSRTILTSYANLYLQYAENDEYIKNFKESGYYRRHHRI